MTCAASRPRSTGWAMSRRAQGDYDVARRHHQQSLSRYRRIEDRWGIARVLSDLASIDLQARDFGAANRSLKQALQAFRALGHQRGVARQLEALSWCAGRQSRDREAILLASAAAAIRLRIGTPAKQAERDKVERTLARRARESAPTLRRRLAGRLDRPARSNPWRHDGATP